MMTGAISGEMMNATSRLRPRKLLRTKASAAGAPSAVASTMTAPPIHRLSSDASIQSERLKKFSYQRRLKPGGGKLR